MQYVFSMTSRMVTIGVTCALLLCVLLFVMGVEIGARIVAPSSSAADESHVSWTAAVTPTASAAPAAPPAATTATSPTGTVTPATPGSMTDTAAVPASSTN